MVSFRLGGGDGVAVEAAKWSAALVQLGWDVRSVAGSGTADTILPGLAIDAPEPPTVAEVEHALAGADLVIVENLASLPLNPPRRRLSWRRCARGVPRSSTITTFPGSGRTWLTSRHRPTTRLGRT